LKLILEAILIQIFCYFLKNLTYGIRQLLTTKQRQSGPQLFSSAIFLMSALSKLLAGMSNRRTGAEQ